METIRHGIRGAVSESAVPEIHAGGRPRPQQGGPVPAVQDGHQGRRRPQGTAPAETTTAVSRAGRIPGSDGCVTVGACRLISPADPPLPFWAPAPSTLGSGSNGVLKWGKF